MVSPSESWLHSNWQRGACCYMLGHAARRQYSRRSLFNLIRLHQATLSGPTLCLVLIASHGLGECLTAPSHHDRLSQVTVGWCMPNWTAAVPVSSQRPRHPAHSQDWYSLHCMSSPWPQALGIFSSIFLGGPHPSILHLGFLGLFTLAPLQWFPPIPLWYTTPLAKRQKSVCGIVLFTAYITTVGMLNTPFTPHMLPHEDSLSEGRWHFRAGLEPLDTPPRVFLFSLTVLTIVRNYMVLWVFVSLNLPTGLQASWAESGWSFSCCGSSSGLRVWLTEILVSY